MIDTIKQIANYHICSMPTESAGLQFILERNGVAFITTVTTIFVAIGVAIAFPSGGVAKAVGAGAILGVLGAVISFATIALISEYDLCGKCGVVIHVARRGSFSHPDEILERHAIAFSGDDAKDSQAVKDIVARLEAKYTKVVAAERAEIDAKHEEESRVRKRIAACKRKYCKIVLDKEMEEHGDY